MLIIPVAVSSRILFFFHQKIVQKLLHRYQWINIDIYVLIFLHNLFQLCMLCYHNWSDEPTKVRIVGLTYAKKKSASIIRWFQMLLFLFFHQIVFKKVVPEIPMNKYKYLHIDILA